MSIYPLILLIIFGILLALALDRKAIDVIPVYVFTFLICLFGLALIKKPHHAFDFSLVYFAATLILFIIKKRKALKSIDSIKVLFTPKSVSTGLILYFVVLIVMSIAYGNHVVNNWDDFHFNATFARDMFAYGGMPTGYKSATGYRTYKPLMQLFYNWGFQANGHYIETLMFRYKSFLLYTAMLPLFALIDGLKGKIAKISATIAIIVLPYAFLFEIVDSLSMDAMMGLLCAYTLTSICFSNNKDWFYYVRITVGLVTLVLVKSTAVMFVAICFAVLLVSEVFEYLKEKNSKCLSAQESADNQTNIIDIQAPSIGILEKINLNSLVLRIIRFLGMGMITGVAWLSWKVFCDRNGNTTYLNTMLDGSLESGNRIPWYGKQTLIDGFKGLFLQSLNLGRFSLSMMTTALIVLIIAVIVIKAEKSIKENASYYNSKPGGDGSSNDTSNNDTSSDNKLIAYNRSGKILGLGFINWVYVVILGGIIPYFAVLMYTYIFVFEEYEALEFASYDRYLGTYALAIMYFAIYHLCVVVRSKFKYLITAVTVLLLLTLNYPVLANGLIPARYYKSHEGILASRTEAEMEMASVMPEHVEAEIILMVSNEVQTVYGRGLNYAAIPLVANSVVIDELDVALGDELADRLANEHIGYVYFSHRLSHDDIMGCDFLSVTGEVLPGTLYRFNEESGLLDPINK